METMLVPQKHIDSGSRKWSAVRTVLLIDSSRHEEIGEFSFVLKSEGGNMPKKTGKHERIFMFPC